MSKIALYCRVSTSEQNLDAQIDRLTTYAKQNKFEYDLFEEMESTRKTRPVKQELMERARKKEYESIVVYKLDRWARSSHELILSTKELTDKGIGFISLTDNLDFSTASGKLHFQILSAFAEFERALISERTKEALRRKKETGVKLGRPKGSKDKKQRKKSGYYVREMKKREEKAILPKQSSPK